MNEKIRELAEQATRNVESGNSYHSMVFDKEKFAELIVQECIDIIAPYTVRMSKPGEEYLHPILEIRKHFGVEE